MAHSAGRWDPLPTAPCVLREARLARSGVGVGSQRPLATVTSEGCAGSVPWFPLTRAGDGLSRARESYVSGGAGTQWAAPLLLWSVSPALSRPRGGRETHGPGLGRGPGFRGAADAAPVCSRSVHLSALGSPDQVRGLGPLEPPLQPPLVCMCKGRPGVGVGSPRAPCPLALGQADDLVSHLILLPPPALQTAAAPGPSHPSRLIPPVGRDFPRPSGPPRVSRPQCPAAQS